MLDNKIYTSNSKFRVGLGDSNVLGENVVEDAVQQDIQEQKALEEKRQMEQMPKGSIHERLAWGARKSSRKAALWQSKNRVLG